MPPEPAVSASGRRVAIKRLGVTFAGLAIAVGVFAGFALARNEKSPARPQGHRSAARRHRSRTHIETWAFDDACNGGAGARSALVRRWVTFAESDCGPRSRKAGIDCHSRHRVYCTVMQYLDTDWNYPVEGVPVQRASSASWWLHDPSPHRSTRILGNQYGGGHLLNQRNPRVRAFFRAYARRHYNSDQGLLLDWQSAGLAQELYYASCGCRTTREIRSDRVLRAGHEQMSAALTHRNGQPFIQADNTLPVNPYLPQGLDMLRHSKGVDGLVAEGLPEQSGTLDPYYSTLLDQIAYVATRTRGFVVPMSRGAAGAAYQLQSRRVQEATMLVGYSPGHLVDWANLEVGSRHLAVWPEEGLYPARPVQSMHAPRGHGCLAGTGQVCSRGGHNNVKVAPGVYRREFRACYRAGAPIGPCAAIVNTTASAKTVRSSWLKRAYHHQIAFIGGDVQSGGTIDLTGAPFSAGSTSVGPRDAMLLAR